MNDISKASTPAGSKDRSGDFIGARPEGADAALVLADGEVFWGRCAWDQRRRSVLQHLHDRLSGGPRRPSYAGRLISFTFPHIGNVGVNKNVPHYTAMTGAAAAVDGIEALSAVGLEVMPLQAYFIFSF